MSQGFRTTRLRVVSALLLSAVAMAQAGGNKTDAATQEHHSKMSKLAFWRHHGDANKNAKEHAAKPAKVNQAQAKQAELKPATAKQSQASTMQVRPISTKHLASKTETKQTTKPASPLTTKNAAKAPSAQPRKSQQKSVTAQNAPTVKKDPAK